ncbi:MAG: hypothetical protein K8T90_20140 [Planctomycetes bacterium]|nr:hypothetical protein [Planctomycetota bacterium]
MGRNRICALALAAVGALALLAGCDNGRSTPEATWIAVQRAIETGDSKQLVAIHDADTLEHRRQVMRQFRALLLRGDPPERALGGTDLTPAEVTGGTLDDAVGSLFAKHSPLVRDAAWYLGAALKGVDHDGSDGAKLRLLGSDGKELALWLVREPGGWAVDHRRTWAGK